MQPIPLLQGVHVPVAVAGGIDGNLVNALRERACLLFLVLSSDRNRRVTRLVIHTACSTSNSLFQIIIHVVMSREMIVAVVDQVMLGSATSLSASLSTRR
jgi:hypothetical protein